MARIHCFLEHPGIELDPAQFPVDEEGRMFEERTFRLLIGRTAGMPLVLCHPAHRHLTIENAALKPCGADRYRKLRRVRK